MSAFLLFTISYYTLDFLKCNLHLPETYVISLLVLLFTVPVTGRSIKNFSQL